MALVLFRQTIRYLYSNPDVYIQCPFIGKMYSYVYFRFTAFHNKFDPIAATQATQLCCQMIICFKRKERQKKLKCCNSVLFRVTTDYADEIWVVNWKVGGFIPVPRVCEKFFEWSLRLDMCLHMNEKKKIQLIYRVQGIGVHKIRKRSHTFRLLTLLFHSKTAKLTFGRYSKLHSLIYFTGVRSGCGPIRRRQLDDVPGKTCLCPITAECVEDYRKCWTVPPMTLRHSMTWHRKVRTLWERLRAHFTGVRAVSAAVAAAPTHECSPVYHSLI